MHGYNASEGGADGFRAGKVKLVWVTPEADNLVASMARVSAPENQKKYESAPKLISYLIKHQHWSPFEMVSACMEIDTSRDIGRQLLRHRSFSFQEFSQRYASVRALPEGTIRETRLQDPKNRQSSIETDDDALHRDWEFRQHQVISLARSHYDWALDHGIAKEVARAVLPEGLTPSRLYMAGTLRSWLHFCALRRGNGTQKETRELADEIWEILTFACPMICFAWDKHREG
jgi:thymidylate synthase (FAD)